MTNFGTNLNFGVYSNLNDIYNTVNNLAIKVNKIENLLLGKNKKFKDRYEPDQEDSDIEFDLDQNLDTDSKKALNSKKAAEAKKNIEDANYYIEMYGLKKLSQYLTVNNTDFIKANNTYNDLISLNRNDINSIKSEIRKLNMAIENINTKIDD